MPWNWQHQDWPEFAYDAKELSAYEDKFLLHAGTMHGSLKHIQDNDQDSLIVDLMSNEAYKTSEIEGEILNRDSLQSSIRKHFGLKSDHRRTSPAEQGIAEMMIDLYQNWQSPLSDKELFAWHEMLTNGRRDLQDIGRYRTHDEPMQIVSGSIHDPKVHFEAPPSKALKKEMKQFITWFNQTGQGGKTELPALTRSGVVHLYFESIHPFEDGNGRIGRALSEKSLSQSLGRPTLIALSHTIQNNRKSYYAALHAASKDLDVAEWLIFFCETVLEAQKYTQSMIDFLIEKGKFYKRHADQLNDRQTKAIERMFREGVGGFEGGLSAENYISITDAARATATRDLQRLVEQGAFVKTGELKKTRYYLNIEHESVLRQVSS